MQANPIFKNLRYETTSHILNMFYMVKGKGIPITGHEGPWGMWM